jgi:ankyrin repeat protein
LDDTIHDAAALGDAEAVRRWLAADARLATLKDGATGRDPLTHLCFSEHLRRDRLRAAGFLDAARALLDAGASANTGFYVNDEFESVLYGAAAVAHDAALTRLLLERGADPNDGEVAYHAPETHDNAALLALIDSGRLGDDSLATMLLRKCDWHDHHGVALLLEHGADPNRLTPWGYTALHQAIRRDNRIETIALLLDYGADPGVHARGGRSATVMAAWEGRGDVLGLLRRRGRSIDVQGVDRLAAACAAGDAETVRVLAGEPALVREFIGQQGALLGEFAGIGNTAGTGFLLDLGADVRATVGAADGYWGIAANSMALHVAAWRACHATVKLLLERGAPVDLPDGNGRTPLMLAVRACVDSHWKQWRSPESVAALVAAGASADGIALPTGYAAIDALLVRARQSKRFER